MDTFSIYKPVAKGHPTISRVDAFADLLGFGVENAIKRNDLTDRCVKAGLIDPDTVDKDRSMRNLLKRARREYVILNDGDGKGYYRPLPKDLVNLAKSNKREKGRIAEIYMGTKMANALEEDLRHERMEEVE